MEPIEPILFDIIRTDYYQSGSIGPSIIFEDYKNLDINKAFESMESLHNDALVNNKDFTVIHYNFTSLITMDLNPVITGLVVSKFTMTRQKRTIEPEYITQ